MITTRRLPLAEIGSPCRPADSVPGRADWSAGGVGDRLYTASRATRVPYRTGAPGTQRTTTVTFTPLMSW